MKGWEKAQAGYDAWLEKPYVDAAKEEEGFEEFCEREGVEFDAPDAWEQFRAWCEEQNEEHDVARYEAHLERQEMEMEERDEW